MSSCNFPLQLTCDSGHCANILKRCNEETDCKDASDEEQCNVVIVPSNYDKSSHPKNIDGVSQPNAIFTQVKIIHVDSLDTVNMEVELTVEFSFRWKDFKLTYLNLMDHNQTITGRRNLKNIPNEERANIWTPLPELIHDNAIVGETKTVNFYKMSVEVGNDPLPLDIHVSKENLIYPGKDNMLKIQQRMKLKYRCDFILVYFPFDDSTCDFYLSILTNGNNSIKLSEDANPIVYEGPRVLNEFQIEELQTRTTHSDTNTTLIFSVRFKRLYLQHLLTTFFQSFLLWVLAYVTLFIDEKDFSNRFMGAVTSLLVLAALLSSIENVLPKTAYFKFVDLWFNWFIVNIFLIILMHVLIDHYINVVESAKHGELSHDCLKELLKIEVWKKETRKGSKINRSCKRIIPFINILFIVTYFSFSTWSLFNA